MATTQIQKKLLRDKCLAASIGFLVPGVLGWLTATQGTRINNLASGFFKQVFNPGGTPTASWSWSVYFAIAAIMGICILGYSPALNFYYRKSDRAWIWFAALPISIIIQIAAFQSPLSTEAVFTWSSIVAALVAAGLWPTEIRKKDKVEDKLYREFFASRIVNHLEKPNNFIRRIAVMGPWGSGKTHVLKLIRQALEESTEAEFRIAWVNPWKASSKEEAVKLLAEAIDQALDLLSVTPWGWHKSRWLGVVASLIPGKDVGQQFLEAVTSHFPQLGEAFLRQIDEEIDKRGVRVVIFVDDMERADPDVVRGILPVIDYLSDLKNFYFIFAIDRDQMEFAFQSVAKSIIELENLPQNDKSTISRICVKQNQSLASSMAQGFLDKVMDLQLTLPDPTPIEIHHWIGERIDMVSHACPRLKSAFDLFTGEILPRNPRICEKFLKEAERIEVLFLKDYDLNEKNYYALFLVIMGDVELPGFRESVGRHFGAFASGAGLMVSGEKLRASPEFDQLVNLVSSEVGVSQDVSHSKYVRAKQLLAAMCDLIGLGVLAYGGKSLDLAWICSGYLARLHLPWSQMKAVANRWESNSCTSSLPNLLREAVSKQGHTPSHMEMTLFQILEMQVSDVQKLLQQTCLRSHMNEDVTADLKRAICMLKPFSRHFDPSRGQLEPVEENILTPQLAGDFLKLIREVPIAQNDSTEWQELRDAIVDAFAAVVSAVPWERKKTISLEQWQLDFGAIRDPKHRQAALEIVSDVRNRMKESIVREFIVRLGNPLDSREFPFWEKNNCPAPILQPDRWIPGAGTDFDLSLLSSLGEQADDCPILRSNVRRIVKDLILDPLVDRYRGDSMSPAILRKMLIGDGKYRDYLRIIWNTAVKGSGSPDAIQEMIGLRNQILETIDSRAVGQGGDPFENNDAEVKSSGEIEKAGVARNLTQADFDEAFPLPDTAPNERADQLLEAQSK